MQAPALAYVILNAVKDLSECFYDLSRYSEMLHVVQHDSAFRGGSRGHRFTLLMIVGTQYIASLQ
jgi:hypothetical protein